MSSMSPATVGTSTWWARWRLAVDDVGDPGVAEAPEPEAEVERRAEDHDEVGAGLQHAAGAQEGQLVVGGDRAATEAVEEARHAQLLDRGAQRLHAPSQ